MTDYIINLRFEHLLRIVRMNEYTHIRTYIQKIRYKFFVNKSTQIIYIKKNRQTETPHNHELTS